MTNDQLLIGFYGFLSVTVVTLLVAIGLAHKHRARAHIVAVGVFLVLLVTSLGFAEVLGRRYEFDHISYTIHLPLALFTSAFMLVPLITGIQHWRGKVTRKAHKVLAWVWVGFVVASLVTGKWMLDNGTLKPEYATPTVDERPGPD